MAGNMQLQAGMDIADLNAEYGYPATALVFQVQNTQTKIHFIWYNGAPGTSFNNAPNGSILVDMAASAPILYAKDYGTNGIGGKDGTWHYSAAMSS